MRVLVACEFSGRVRDAFRLKGHDAYSCDIIKSDQKSKYHIVSDALKIINDRWDLIIAHPPCTYLSNAGARHLFAGGVLNKERYKKGLRAKEFFTKIMEADCPRICIENPVPSKVYELPPYTQLVQPYHFGEPFQKKTCLWLKGLKPLAPTDIVEPTSNCHDAGTWFMRGGKDRQKNRAMTFQGIANAMATQWGKKKSLLIRY